MGKSKLETTLLYVAFACMAAALFRQSLHLPLWSEMVFAVAGIVSFLTMFAVRRRSRTAASPQAARRRSQPVALRLYSLFPIVAVSLSGPWWLPYTGVHLDFRHLVVVAIITCIAGVSLYLVGWWYATRNA